MIYGQRRSGGEHGTVYTRPEVVDFMLDLAGLRNADDFLGKKTIDPCVGEGAFTLGLARRALSALQGDIDGIGQALRNITVVELDPEKLDIFIASLKSVLVTADARLRDHWRYVSILKGDYLLVDSGRFDVVIGNPPYVRYDNIPAEKTDVYRRLFACFRARSDLYIAFIEKGIRSLNAGGTLVYVCADRWLTNGYGSMLRKTVARNFHLSELVKISGFNPFAEEVTAYPAIFAIRNESPEATSYFVASDVSDLEANALPKRASTATLDEDGQLRLRTETPGFVSIEEQGFRIGIGVATGADDVLIVRKAEVDIEDEILVPLLARDDIDGDRITWTDRYVINPFIGNSRRLVDLDGFPLLSRYLNEHRPELERRYTAQKNAGQWYRTIDRIHPSLRNEPKLLIPDITSRNAIVLDEGEFYPHHNFYYIAGNGRKNLEALRALLSTEFARGQVAEKGVLMNGGSLRWQAQTLRKLRLPDLRPMPEKDKDQLIAAYDAKDFRLIERIAKLRAA